MEVVIFNSPTKEYVHVPQDNKVLSPLFVSNTWKLFVCTVWIPNVSVSTLKKSTKQG